MAKSAATALVHAMASTTSRRTMKETRLANAANQQKIRDIQTLESFAHARGMHVTAHALNRAKNALGWEIAGDIDQAAKAAFALSDRT